MKPSTSLGLVAFACLSVAGVSGCNIVGPATLLVAGPSKVAKLHTLEPKRPTIVFVDDPVGQLPRRALREIIARETGRNLLEERSLERVIDPRAALAVVTRDKPGEPVDLSTLAKACEAEVVIAISVHRFTLSPDGASFRPEAEVRVRVIDATRTEPRVWPQERLGHLLTVSPALRPGDVPTKPGDIVRAEDALATEVGLAVARLFYDFDPRRGADLD